MTDLETVEEVNDVPESGHNIPMPSALDEGDDDQGPIEGTGPQREDAAARRFACHTAIQEALVQFRCRIVPLITVKTVGSDPVAEALVSAGWDLYPEVVE